MKFSTTLSLIIGSFFVAVKGQEGITADIRYELHLDGVSESYYALACNDTSLYSNHPKDIKACQELEEYVVQAQTTGQPVSTLLGNALDPSQPIQNPIDCNVIGGEALLKIIFMEINNDVVGGPNNPQLSSFTYTNGCVMKMIAEQAKLSHLLPFFETNSLPVPPLNDNLS
ncbi:hypothetical protein INT45_005274 [Circinella minor]|uniref:Uncharacterized protein n=1 Tax=Circinella minor TaxID=1195481 RepID=A0A8H7RV63_9FUNG|nr:hypothetical protein INT45_005274 [Circinella minor]